MRLDGYRLHNRYEVRGLLGRGGSGIVHAVLDLETGQTYAAKLKEHSRIQLVLDGTPKIPPSCYLLNIPYSQDSLSSDTKKHLKSNPFLPEITAAGIFMQKCPGVVVRYYVIGNDLSYYYIIMHLCGSTLDTYISKHLLHIPDSGLARSRLVHRLAQQVLRFARTVANLGKVVRDVSTRNFLLAHVDVAPTDPASTDLVAIDLSMLLPVGTNYGVYCGTPRYSSINNQEGGQASFFDDLEAAGYIILEAMTNKLHWRNAKLSTNILVIKQQCHQEFDKYFGALPAFLKLMIKRKTDSDYLATLSEIDELLKSDGVVVEIHESAERFTDHSLDFKEFDGLGPPSVSPRRFHHTPHQPLKRLSK